jgi:hypothetical protein
MVRFFAKSVNVKAKGQAVKRLRANCLPLKN